MLESIFKAIPFFAERGKQTEIIFATEFSPPIKTHTVRVLANNNIKYINVPCSSGASGMLKCSLCSMADKNPESVFKPRKIYVATVYTKLSTPFEDSNKVIHTYGRRLFVVSYKLKKASVDPYINKYGTIKGAKFLIERGEESKNYNGDLYKFSGFVNDISTAIGEPIREFDVDAMFTPLTKNELDELMMLINMASNHANANKNVKSSEPDTQPTDDYEMPF